MATLQQILTACSSSPDENTELKFQLAFLTISHYLDAGTKIEEEVAEDNEFKADLYSISTVAGYKYNSKPGLSARTQAGIGASASMVKTGFWVRKFDEIVEDSEELDDRSTYSDVQNVARLEYISGSAEAGRKIIAREAERADDEFDLAALYDANRVDHFKTNVDKDTFLATANALILRANAVADVEAALSVRDSTGGSGSAEEEKLEESSRVTATSAPKPSGP